MSNWWSRRMCASGTCPLWNPLRRVSSLSTRWSSNSTLEKALPSTFKAQVASCGRAHSVELKNSIIINPIIYKKYSKMRKSLKQPNGYIYCISKKKSSKLPVPSGPGGWFQPIIAENIYKFSRADCTNGRLFDILILLFWSYMIFLSLYKGSIGTLLKTLKFIFSVNLVGFSDPAQKKSVWNPRKVFFSQSNLF